MNKKYFSYITIISFLISFSLTIQTTFAGVVPGTIKKGSASTSVECIPNIKPYGPTGGSANMNYGNGQACGVENYFVWGYLNSDPNKTILSGVYPVNSAPGVTVLGSYPDSYKSCYNPSFGYTSSPSGSLNYNDYLSNSDQKQFSSAGFTTILTSDALISCFAEAIVDISHKPPDDYYWLCPYSSCTPSGFPAKIAGTGRNAQCNKGNSTDNLIQSFDQLGSVSRVPGIAQNKKECTVEGRYASPDTSVSNSVVLNLDSVFNAGDDVWCNINKYRAPGVKYLEHPGCKTYDDKNTINTFGEDLLKGLTITIPGDVSGIGSVEIQLGTCNGTITSNSNNLNTILVNITSASGVKPTYTNGFTILYNDSVFALGKNQPSLLTLFSKTRLDECLTEGKNKLVVEIKDMARNDKDGITLASNSVKYISAGSINIDNSNVYLDFKTDFKDLINGLTPPDTTINNNILWKNHTIEGNIMMGEKYKGGPKNECNPFKAENTGDCNTGNPSKPTNNDLIWIFPNGVNPTNGKYTQYTCGNTTFPTNLDCQWGCKDPAKVWDGNSCVSGCSAEKVNIPGVGCMDYCIADKTVDCIVKEDGPVNTLPYCMGDGQVDCIVKEDGPVNTLPYCMGDGQVDCIVKEDGTSTPINTNTLPYCMGDSTSGLYSKRELKKTINYKNTLTFKK